MAITTILYVLVSVSVVGVVNYNELAQSSAPLTLIFQKATGLNLGNWFSVIALISISNTLLLVFLTTTRIMYAMGQDNSLPRAFAKLHEKRRIPHIAIFSLAGIAIPLIFIKDIALFAQLTNIVILAVFTLVNLCVIKLRYSHSHIKGFNVPFSIGKLPIFPLLGAITSLCLLIFTLMHVVRVFG
jgi:APA family basic amino acid/polyamine antiporter